MFLQIVWEIGIIDVNHLIHMQQVAIDDYGKDGGPHFTQCMIGICPLATHSYQNLQLQHKILTTATIDLGRCNFIVKSTRILLGSWSLRSLLKTVDFADKTSATQRMQILKTVESRTVRLGGEKSQKNENSERKLKSSNVVFGRVNWSHCNTFVMLISRECDSQCFILFSNVLRTF